MEHIARNIGFSALKHSWRAALQLDRSQLIGAFIQSGKPVDVFYGYVIGAALMAAAGLIEVFFDVSAERQPLENVARPLSFVEEAVAA